MWSWPAIRAARHDRQVVSAIRAGAELAQAHLPVHMHLGPDTVTAMPTTGTGFASTDMIRTQAQLTVELVRCASAFGPGRPRRQPRGPHPVTTALPVAGPSATGCTRLVLGAAGQL